MNSDGIALLKEYEGFRSKAYPDPATGGEPWTIGYGFTYLNGIKVKKGDTITRGEADAMLVMELMSYERQVKDACEIEPNENQLAAMVCFAWNVGIAGFKKSSVLKAHNRGDWQSAARAFGLWNKAAGKVMAGLTRRRAAESALYLKPVAEFGRIDPEPLPMPQVVQEEGTLAKSPMMLVSGGTGAATIIGTVAEASYGVRSIKDNLGDMLPWAIAGLAIAVCAFLMIQRYRQRRGGWA